MKTRLAAWTVGLLCAAAAAPAGQRRFAKDPVKAGQEPAAKLLSPAAQVRIEYPLDDPAWKRSFEAIARHQVALYERLVSAEPFLGRRPFVVRRSTDGMPRATVGERAYIVFVIPEKGWHAQLAYQFGHELGHFWIGPASTSQFQESVCTALSFVALDELAGYWERNPGDLEQAAWAGDLRNYHAWVTYQRQLEGLGLKSVDEAMIWARDNGPALLAISLNRDKEQVMAKVIERVLRRHPGRWGALKQLGAIEGHNDPGMFGRWLKLVRPEDRPLVADLATAFGAPVGKTGAAFGMESPPAEQTLQRRREGVH